MGSTSSDRPCDTAQTSISQDDQRVYFVPFKWWKESQDSSSLVVNSEGKQGALFLATKSSSYSGPMKLINNIFNPDIMFDLRWEDDSRHSFDKGEPGVSGRDYAIITGEMWSRTLKRCSKKCAGSSMGEDVDMDDGYPLQLKLILTREVNSIGVKISKKDNAVEHFKRACKIFNVDIELLRIWDFSGRIGIWTSSEKIEFQRQSDQEVLLELQVYGISDSIKCKEGKREDTSMLLARLGGASSDLSALNNRSSSNCHSSRINSSIFAGSSESGSLGLTGLQNLGNTCFMNSALQCLAHTPKLVDYFLNDYTREINRVNPLGMDGEIALAFGDLIKSLWAPGASSFAPRVFKSKLAHFAPQFGGFNQHDSQELLAFLLDGLHEDLNRVKCKPYFEAKDEDGRPDEDVADEYWRNHLARNDSVIVDLYQGQYKSTLICPVCKKVSVTFDPFMYLSLPLPSTSMRSMTLTVMLMDGKSLPFPVTVTVPKNGKSEDLFHALAVSCSLPNDEMFLLSEVFNNRIIRFLEDPSDSLSLIRDEDRLVACRFPKDTGNSSVVVFLHQQLEEQYLLGKQSSRWKSFGIPLVARISPKTSGSDIHDLYSRLLNPFTSPSRTVADRDNVSQCTLGGASENENLLTSKAYANEDLPNGEVINESTVPAFEFSLADDKGIVKESKIEMDKPLACLEEYPRRLYIVARWPENKPELSDTTTFGTLPEIYKSGFLAKRPKESVSLYRCLEAFLNEEPLGPEDMWYCPRCKEHRQATKKLDLWRLPEMLVIHLKRFSYSRYTKNKLESYVDFPIVDLDLANYVATKIPDATCRYALYAISNHYGGLGSGHYTAFVHHGGGHWYEFDDSRVSPISEEKIKTSAAYLLFYRRIADS